MNDLRLLIEDLSCELSDLIEKSSFETEKLNDLLKPWRFKLITDSPEETETSCEHDNVEDKFLSDMEKVDDVLRQARLIRKHPNSQANESSKSSKTVSKDRLKKQNLKPKPSSSTLKQRDIREKSLTCSSNSNTKHPIQVKSVKTLTNPKLDVANQQQNQAANVPAKATTASNVDNHLGDNFAYHHLDDVIKEHTLPSKYLKLRHMHCKLMKSILKSRSLSMCCESEQSFISNLFNSTKKTFKKQDANISVVAAITMDKLILSPAIAKCLAYTNTLKLKMPFSNQDSSPVALYFNKLAYSKVNEAFVELENFYQQLKETSIPKLSLPIHSTKAISISDMPSYRLPCSYLIFDSEAEVAQNSFYIEEIKWLQLNILLKHKIHDVLLTELENLIQKDHEKGSKFALRLLPVAIGLLAKPNRYAINPAVVQCS